MTETVRIVQRQPIEAKRDEFGEGYYTERGASIVHRDYLNSGGVGWVEVSDPIVWDGNEASTSVIADALPGAWEVDSCYPGWLDIWQMAPNDGEAFLWARLRPGWRIQIVGDSFVILPPEECQS